MCQNSVVFRRALLCRTSDYVRRNVAMHSAHTSNAAIATASAISNANIPSHTNLRDRGIKGISTAPVISSATPQQKPVVGTMTLKNTCNFRKPFPILPWLISGVSSATIKKVGTASAKGVNHRMRVIRRSRECDAPRSVRRDSFDAWRERGESYGLGCKVFL